jgi:5,10-methylenetetrahydrofolate reductase
MENNDKPYYVTEKLVNGIRAGVVPIYWGTSRVTEFFNHRRFFHLCPNPTVDDIQDMITRMKEMTDQQFLEIVKQPVLIRPIDEIYDELLSSIKKILT